MRTPRTLKSALEHGYKITKVRYSGEQKNLVVVEPRFPREGMKPVLSFWLSREYVQRNDLNPFAF